MKTKRQIKQWLTGFIFLLILSGVTAFPIQSEIQFLAEHHSAFPQSLSNWILTIHHELKQTPDLAFYGTDWLAFAHIIIALFFIPLFKNPIQYELNLKIGMAACLFVFPLAFICGPIRQIPFFHQLIDCSFGVFGFLVLYRIYSLIQQLKHDTRN